MPVPNPSDACIRLDIVVPSFRWRFPFGTLDIQYNGLPIPADIVGDLIARANAALLPLVPLFDIIDAILGLEALFDAIKSLSAYQIKEQLEKWLTLLATLKGGIPPLSIPAFLKDSVYVLILFLTALRADLEAIIESKSTIDLGGARATVLGSADLQSVITCSQANLDLELSLLVKSNAEPLARFIGLVNFFARLAKLPEIPAIEIDGDATVALSNIDDAIASLQALHDSLPE